MKADFGKILSEAFKITLRNKWLWVFGLVIATLSSGSGFNFSNYSRLFNTASSGRDKQEQRFKDILKNRNFKEEPSEFFHQTGKVLGEASISTKNLLVTIPFYYYVLLVFFVLISVVVGVAVTMYARAWASGSLIHGINLETVGTTATLSNSSKAGRANAVEMIKLSFVPSLTLTLIFLVVSTPELILLVKLPGLAKVIFGLMLFITFMLFIVALIVAGASVLLGSIALVLENLNWKAALSKGYLVFKKFVLDVVVMGVINCFLGGIAGVVSCVVIIPLILVGIAGIAGVTAAPLFALIIFPIGALVLVAVGLVLMLIRGISVVFVEATWVLLYKQLIESMNGSLSAAQDLDTPSQGEIIGGVS